MEKCWRDKGGLNEWRRMKCPAGAMVWKEITRSPGYQPPAW